MRQIYWVGEASGFRKLWLRAGRCAVEVWFDPANDNFAWVAKDSRGRKLGPAREPTKEKAKIAALKFLVSQAQQSKPGDPFYVGRSARRRLLIFAALNCLEG